MNKDKLIQLIESELVQADEATSDAAFEKHLYAIHTLTSLYVEQQGTQNASTSRQHYPEVNKTHYSASSYPSQSAASSRSSQKSQQDVTVDEIKAMGGKVPASMQQSQSSDLPSNKMVTDDEIGNGDSIFDF
ncbi:MULTISPECIES: DUF5327 family protein [Staphylococcus]|uniref:YwdI family protein n=1 Tax=Staphylococcus pettenkoferi TaxID=170573 RepID=A0A2N6QM26_9STAP|nr:MULTISPECIES: DUF5327 family protein [Staphylococcus]MBX8992958.1 YwdI family protein [Staphylococcus pettenkoferi]MCI2790832.1 YwdI family protein [Staphylococcus pettenkoferi]MCY1566998.1 YwdI family protein [Staphylococcus pettenkoferi]MCY1587378.1 YwdI family protein [Staphylococcus pettenkoferi]MCY1603059.1 YwdI family protein [Staphylococcus pettenkoferi]